LIIFIISNPGIDIVPGTGHQTNIKAM